MCSCDYDENIVDNEEISEVTVCDEISYGDQENQNLDIIYTFPISNKPIIFYVHGGGWFMGDKKEFNEKIASFFISKGFICVSVNYPLSPYPYNFEENKNRHPEHIKSVFQAFNWIEENISKYGGDPNTINVMGHSAGSQLVALLTFESEYSKLKNKNCIKNALILDGGSYLTGDKKVLSLNLSHTQMVENAIGKNTDYETSDFFPINNGSVINKDINYILIHSSDDYRTISNKLFINFLKERNYKYQEYILDKYNHIDVLNNIPLYWQALGLEL